MSEEKQCKLTIAIPTYNRCEFLIKNLKKIEQMIFDLDAQDIVEILISDNGSTDGTEKRVRAMLKGRVSIIYHCNEKNIGPRVNIANLFGKVRTKYMLLLGDDDFISKEYLERVLTCLENDIGCIIPSYINVDLDGKDNGRGRDLKVKSKKYEPGFRNCLANAWRGHQMSGLVFRVENLMEEIEKKNIYNYYLQIYALAYCCLHGSTYHITEYPVRVTRPPQKSKDWGYGTDGLIGNVFENFVKLDLTRLQKVELEMKFLVDQYWRYAMYLKKGVRDFLTCIKNILCSTYTLWPTKILFAVSFMFILGGKAIALLFNGKLVQTLMTKVDI